MTNKELQTYLQEFPDDMEVVMHNDGSIWLEPRNQRNDLCEHPQKKKNKLFDFLKWED